MLDVAVVIPARNAADTLGYCLDGLAAQDGAGRFRTVVVDDGSTDATAAIAGHHRISPVVVRGPGRGSYAARNAGAAAAEAAVLAFTDADCIPSPGWLAAGWTALNDTDHSWDLVGGRIAWLTEAEGPVARYDRATYLTQEQFVTEQAFAATANLFVPAAVFHRLGGFDEGLRSGGDVEFGNRARAAGYRLGFADDAVVWHRPRTTYRELWALHRRLGTGWAALARRGLRPAWWREPALRMPTLGMVITGAAAQGDPVRRREILPAHVTARTARIVGRLTGR